MKIIKIILLSLFLVACGSQQIRKNIERPVYRYDPGVISSEIEGIAVGMSPSGVLAEFNKNNWSLTSLSSITLEDMVEGGIIEENFYISTKGQKIADLEVFFQDGRVIFIRTTYSIKESEFNNAFNGAKRHLTSLGGYKEKIENNSIQITYQPFKLSYVYYQFYKLVKNQKSYNVSYVVANVKS